MNTLKLLETEVRLIEVLSKAPSSAERIIREVPGINNMRAIQRYLKDIFQNFDILVVFDHKTRCYKITHPDKMEVEPALYVLGIIFNKFHYHCNL